MKRLVVALLMLFALATLADFGARIVVQNVAGDALASQHGVDGPVDVTFGGWPFVLHLIDRRFTSVAVSAEDVRSGGFGNAVGTGAQHEAVSSPSLSTCATSGSAGTSGATTPTAS